VAFLPFVCGESRCHAALFDALIPPFSSGAMNDSSRRNRKLLGIVFLLCIPVCLVAAGIYAFSLPLLFSSSATIKLNFPVEDVPKMGPALEWAKQQVAAKFPRPDGSPEEPPNAVFEGATTPGQYKVVVRHVDASKAADSANQLAIQLRDYLSQKLREAGAEKSPTAEIPEGSEVERHFRIELLVPASPAKEPSRDKFDRVMQLGIGAALAFGFCGTVLIVSTKQFSFMPASTEADGAQGNKTRRRKRKRRGRYDY
jgi:hypothetical protein